MPSVADRASITEENQLKSPLLCLSPDLRNHVYQMVFRGCLFVYAGHTTAPTNERSNKDILLTCRQIKHEASSLLSTTSTFDFDFIYHIGHFTNSLTERQLHSITSLRFPARSTKLFVQRDAASTGIKLILEQFPALKEVRFRAKVKVKVWEELVEQERKVAGLNVSTLFEEEDLDWE